MKFDSLSKKCLISLGVAILVINIQQSLTAAPIESAKNQPINSLTAPLPARNTQTTNLVLKLSDRRVYLYRGDKLATSYPVAIGKAGWETPVGSYKVMEMQRDPVWEHPWTGKLVPPGAKNPLGARWIGFWTDGKNFIGFHGTPQEKLVGQAVSHGCVRMRNQDILALYAQVDVGTPVTVNP
ncbi:L,D-transpeptidase [Synechocystis sp. PCC 7509]|uniref:L,D-transpeptidase n=1 Tax=Synechocystis sp. PCC 7509 TaxID=927677 RepID=UPI0002AD08C0|nr:L,D-transpeptidase [Synechocystis sp. PCC 7509]